MGYANARRVVLPGRRNKPGPIAAVATNGLHVHSVAQRVPHITGIHTVIERLICGATIEVREHHLARKRARVL